MKDGKRQVATIVAEARRKGWRVSGGSDRHYKILCPCGEHMVILGASPSDRAAAINVRARLRRTCWESAA